MSTRDAAARRLDARLRAALTLIARPLPDEAANPTVRRLIDVGCDHAQLALTALAEGVVEVALGIERRPGPLDNARRQTRAAGLEGQLELRLGDGLDGVALEAGDAVAILGMSGAEIAAILSRIDWARRAREEGPRGALRLVLQPMQHEALLRRRLAELGMCLEGEMIVEAEGRVYVLMSVLSAAAPAERSGAQRDLTAAEAIVGHWWLGAEETRRGFPASDSCARLQYLERLRQLWQQRRRQARVHDRSGLVLERREVAALCALLSDLQAQLGGGPVTDGSNED